MPTARQDDDFSQVMSGEIDEVKISKTALDSAISYINDNIEPEEVFDKEKLEAWAESNGYVKE